MADNVTTAALDAVGAALRRPRRREPGPPHRARRGDRRRRPRDQHGPRDEGRRGRAGRHLARRRPAPLLSKVGMTLVSTVGGASGPLTARSSCGWARRSATPTTVAAGAGRRGAAGRARRRRRARQGRARRQDDVRRAGAGRRRARRRRSATGADLGDGAAAAPATRPTPGRDATIPMLARKGRASYLGERSVGHQDPGATSVALLVPAAADTLA